MHQAVPGRLGFASKLPGRQVHTSPPVRASRALMRLLRYSSHTSRSCATSWDIRKSVLALLQRLLGPLALGDVLGDPEAAQQLARIVEFQVGLLPHPFHLPVRPRCGARCRRARRAGPPSTACPRTGGRRGERSPGTSRRSAVSPWARRRCDGSRRTTSGRCG